MSTPGTPGRFDLNLYQGDSRAWRFQLWQDAAQTVPFPLDGITVAAQIRDPSCRMEPINLTLVVTLPNIIDASLSAEDAERAPARGGWDLQLTWPDNTPPRVRTVLAGRVTTVPDITDLTGVDGLVRTS